MVRQRVPHVRLQSVVPREELESRVKDVPVQWRNFFDPFKLGGNRVSSQLVV